MDLRGERAPAWVTDEMIQQAQDYFRDQYPEEAVGFLRGSGFTPLANVAEDKENTFQIDPLAWVAYDTADNPVMAVIHSHPDGPAIPSEADMRGQISSGKPWAIIAIDKDVASTPVWFGDQAPIAPLLARPFVHAIFDCYSLIRDAYRLGKTALANQPDPDACVADWPFDPITLPEFPRRDNWWGRGDNLYLDNFRAAGFDISEGGLEDVQVGDVFFMKLRSPVLNHGGIYVGGGLIMHHVTGYTSHRSPLTIWGPNAEMWVRYKG
jgi:proteasome lid subunit RPN8/RPN11